MACGPERLAETGNAAIGVGELNRRGGPVEPAPAERSPAPERVARGSHARPGEHARAADRSDAADGHLPEAARYRERTGRHADRPGAMVRAAPPPHADAASRPVAGRRDIPARKPPLSRTDSRRDTDHPETADLRRELADLKAARAADRSKIAELRTELADMEAKRDADRAEFTWTVKDLMARVQRLEHGAADMRTAPVPTDDLPPRPDSREEAGPSAADARAVPGRDQRALKADAKTARGGVSDAAIGFASTTAAGVLSEVAQVVPPSAQAATLAGTILSVGVAGFTWARHRRKEKDADRSEG